MRTQTKLLAAGSVVATLFAYAAFDSPGGIQGAEVLAGSLGGPSPQAVAASSGLVEDGRTARFAEGEVVVRYFPEVPARSRRAIEDRVGADLKRRSRVRGLELVRLRHGRSVERGIAEFRKHRQVMYAEPNFIFSAAGTPNDTDFERLWGLHNTGQTVGGVSGTADADIDAPEAWDHATGDPSVVVAVVDTGVAYDHADLASNAWVNAADPPNGADDDGNGFVDDVRGWDWVDRDGDPLDFNGHGTHVAGTIAAEGSNAAGVAGVSWKSRIMPLRVLDASGRGTTLDIADAFAYAGANGADVANASLGGGGFSQAMLDAITGAPNTLFVAAAGNGGADGVGDDNDAVPTYPCAYSAPNLVCVAATTQTDALASFSNFGSTSVDLAAPGTNILSTIPARGAAVYQEGFETDIAGRWVSGGTLPTWSVTTAAARSPVRSLTDSDGGPYPNNADAWARTAEAVDLSRRYGCQVAFGLRLATERSVDFLSVQASRSADGPWRTLGAWSGSTGGSFVSLTADASAFDAGPAYVRFRLTSNASVTADGAYVDDVSLRCLTTPDASSLASFNGTSMAAPHVAGAAALVLAQKPGASVSNVKTALLGSVDPVPALTSLTVSGGRLNVFRALDTAAPRTPTLSGPTLGNPFQTATGLSLNWAASDADSGIGSYDVRYRRAPYNGDFGAYAVWQDSTQATSGTFSASNGNTYCFSVRAADTASPPNVSPWGGESCTAFPANNTRLSHSSNWVQKTASGYYLDTYSTSGTKGATLSLAGVRAARIAIVATRCGTCGTVDVYLGTTLLKRVGLASATRAARQVITVASFGEIRTGTVRIKIASSGKPVIIEGLGISGM